MTHSEKRTHWFREGAIGLGVGVMYGVTSTCVGHPWDTLKTKMQAQSGFEKTNLFQTFLKTLRTQGVVGLYRGCIPPLWGSGIYRSVQFAVFESVYTYLHKSNFWTYEIPGTAGLQMRVLGAGTVAATVRAIIETPLEFAKIKGMVPLGMKNIKSDLGILQEFDSNLLTELLPLPLLSNSLRVRGQTQQSWQLKKVYTGFGVTWVRTMGVMCTYFILVDTGRRNFPEHFKRPILGPFLISGCAATFGWWVVWPFEYMKSQVQSGYGGKKVPVLKRMATVVREKGFFSLYRGILPGTIRSFTANGTSMVVMTFAQRKVSQLGLRD